jgi:hypothetical protein
MRKTAALLSQSFDKKGFGTFNTRKMQRVKSLKYFLKNSRGKTLFYLFLCILLSALELPMVYICIEEHFSFPSDLDKSFANVILPKHPITPNNFVLENVV